MFYLKFNFILVILNYLICILYNIKVCNSIILDIFDIIKIVKIKKKIEKCIISNRLEKYVYYIYF